MALESKNITNALMAPKPKKKDPQYDTWTKNAEEGYKKLCTLGVKIVKEFFTERPMGVCGAAPWGALDKTKNVYKPYWEAFAQKFVNLELLGKEKTDKKGEAVHDDNGNPVMIIDPDKLKQVKEAIYMGSQQLWLDEQAKKTKGFQAYLDQLNYTMRYRLILLKNTDQKADFLAEFFGDKSRQHTMPAFVQALNLNYWANKKCKALLRKISSMDKEIERLKQTPVEDRAEWKLPEKPTIKTVAEAIQRGKLLEVVENETYYRYMANSSNFAKLPKEEREQLIDIVDIWTERLNNIQKRHEAIETLRGVIKASLLL